MIDSSRAKSAASRSISGGEPVRPLSAGLMVTQFAWEIKSLSHAFHGNRFLIIVMGSSNPEKTIMAQASLPGEGGQPIHGNPPH